MSWQAIRVVPDIPQDDDHECLTELRRLRDESPPLTGQFNTYGNAIEVVKRHLRKGNDNGSESEAGG